ncbi:MAG: hypothetical protein ACK4WD_07085 [Flavobacteriales bacterium]
MKIVVSILLSLCFLSAAAQFSAVGEPASIFHKKENTYRDTVWIISGYKPLENNFKKWKFDFVLDARSTLVSGTVARLAGLRIGMEYRRVHRFGFGFYNLGDGVIVKSLEEVNPDITRATLNIRYSSIFYERVMFFNRKWELSLTAHSGRGRITGDYIIAGGIKPQGFPDRRIRAFEFSSTAFYHLTWWFSVGGGVGYRLVPDAPEEVQSIYNAPVGILRVRIKFGKLVKSIWNHDIKYTY